MLLVVKCVLALFIFLSGPLAARDLNILVIGQHAAVDCTSYIPGAKIRVSRIGWDGANAARRDPLHPADCRGGSIWARLGEKLGKSGVATKIAFTAIALPDAREGDWAPGGFAFQKLAAAVQTAKAENIRFDYAFWQGMPESDTDETTYLRKLSRVVKFLSLQVKIDKWLIAQSAECPSESASEIAMALNRYGRNPVYRLFPGPDTAGLNGPHFSTGCNLSESGRLEMAERWFSSMRNADSLNNVFEKESLLYYFR